MLASDTAGGEFSLEPMTPQYLRSVFQSMRSRVVQNLRLLRKQLKTLPPDLVPVAQRVGELESVIVGHCRQLVDQRFAAGRIRIHGDFHLGQILWTSRDFVFLDFEGDANLPISDGFPAYVQNARAYIVLIDTSRQEFVPGEDKTGDGTALDRKSVV